MYKSIDQNKLSQLYSEMIEEDMTNAGVFGNVEGHGGDIENEDFYANGDARYPYVMGLISRKGPIKKKKVKKIKKK